MLYFNANMGAALTCRHVGKLAAMEKAVEHGGDRRYNQIKIADDRTPGFQVAQPILKFTTHAFLPYQSAPLASLTTSIFVTDPVHPGAYDFSVS